MIKKKLKKFLPGSSKFQKFGLRNYSLIFFGPYLRMLSAKFGWNWPIGSGEEIFLNFINDFSLLNYYLSLEKGIAPHLNKLESPSPKDALCQILLKLAHRIWRRRWICEKLTDRQTDGQTADKRLSNISSLELLA